jgi:pilus assembly protein Flp/PilA
MSHSAAVAAASLSRVLRPAPINGTIIAAAIGGKLSKQRKINLEFYRLNYQFSAEINFLNLASHLDRMVHTEEINMKVLTQLLADESGVTAIEYSLIAALIAVAAIGSFTLIGSSLSTTFSTVAGKL